VDKGTQAIELASQVDDPLTEIFARFWTAFAARDMGDSEVASSQAETLLIAAEKVRDRFWLASALWSNEVVYRLKGDWAGARQFSDRGLFISPTDPRILSGRILCEYQVGDFDQGSVYLEQILEVMRSSKPWLTPGFGAACMAVPLVGRTTGMLENLQVPQMVAETILIESNATPYVTTWARASMGLIGTLQGDVQVVEVQYGALGLLSGIMLPGGTVSGDRILALLSQTMGNPDQATDHFEDALAFCRKAGYRPELGWTCCDYADTLRARDAEGDRTKAMFLLDESLAISSELGMRPLMERVLSRREILRA